MPLHTIVPVLFIFSFHKTHSFNVKDVDFMLRLVSSPEHYKGSFKFDSRFLNKPMVKEEIKKAWLTNHAFFGVTVDDKLKRCRKDLSSWKKRQSLNSRDKIVQIQQQLEKEQSALSFRTIRIDYLKGELITTYREEEKY